MCIYKGGFNVHEPGNVTAATVHSGLPSRLSFLKGPKRKAMAVQDVQKQCPRGLLHVCLADIHSFSFIRKGNNTSINWNCRSPSLKKSLQWQWQSSATEQGIVLVLARSASGLGTLMCICLWARKFPHRAHGSDGGWIAHGSDGEWIDACLTISAGKTHLVTSIHH